MKGVLKRTELPASLTFLRINCIPSRKRNDFLEGGVLLLDSGPLGDIMDPSPGDDPLSEKATLESVNVACIVVLEI